MVFLERNVPYFKPYTWRTDVAEGCLWRNVENLKPTIYRLLSEKAREEKKKKMKKKAITEINFFYPSKKL